MVKIQACRSFRWPGCHDWKVKELMWQSTKYYLCSYYNNISGTGLWSQHATVLSNLWLCTFLVSCLVSRCVRKMLLVFVMLFFPCIFYLFVLLIYLSIPLCFFVRSLSAGEKQLLVSSWKIKVFSTVTVFCVYICPCWELSHFILSQSHHL